MFLTIFLTNTLNLPSYVHFCVTLHGPFIIHELFLLNLTLDYFYSIFFFCFDWVRHIVNTEGMDTTNQNKHLSRSDIIGE